MHAYQIWILEEDLIEMYVCLCINLYHDPWCLLHEETNFDVYSKNNSSQMREAISLYDGYLELLERFSQLIKAYKELGMLNEIGNLIFHHLHRKGIKYLSAVTTQAWLVSDGQLSTCPDVSSP